MKKNSLHVLVSLGLMLLLVFVIISWHKYDKKSKLVLHTLKKNDLREITDKKVELGSYLFYDTRLSLNNTKSCASCHNPEFAFSDNYRTSITALGENLLHNAPTLINVRFQQYFDWADTSKTSLEKQLIRPLYNQHPVELGLNVKLGGIIVLFKNDSLYNRLFTNAFPNSTKLFTAAQIEQCIITFVQTLISFNSGYDKYLKGDSNAISPSAKKGLQLFSSNRLKCINCHQPPFFTSNIAGKNKTVDSIYFNTGLYNIHGKENYVQGDQGLYEKSKLQKDLGKFKVPTLRNIAFTAPYTHDGSVASLEEMIDIYSRGGRLIQSGPYKGDGKINPHKSDLINGFSITPAEKKNLIDFLFSISDSSVLKNPAFLRPVHN